MYMNNVHVLPRSPLLRYSLPMPPSNKFLNETMPVLLPELAEFRSMYRGQWQIVYHSWELRYKVIDRCHNVRSIHSSCTCTYLADVGYVPGDVFNSDWILDCQSVTLTLNTCHVHQYTCICCQPYSVRVHTV